MELGEIDLSRLLQERAGLPISPPWIIVYWKQVVNHYPPSDSVSHSLLTPDARSC